MTRPEPPRGIGILSYSPEEKVYTYYGVDNSNMTTMEMQGGDGKWMEVMETKNTKAP